MPGVGNETNHTENGLTVQGGLAIGGKPGTAAYIECDNNGFPATVAADAGYGRLSLATDAIRDIMLGHQPGVRTVRDNAGGRVASFLSTAGTLTSGTMRVVPVAYLAGDVVRYISFRSNSTAANGPTNWWFALYDDASTPALMQQSADQLTTAWGASTIKTLELASPVTIPRSGVYMHAINVTVSVATPTLDTGTTVTGLAFLSFWKTGGNTNQTGLTGTAPATVGTITASATVPYTVGSSAS